MSYRSPFWVCAHAWRVAGSSALAASSEASGFSAARVIDDQGGPLFKWGSAAAGNTLTLDRGSAALEACDRLLIPAGHNLNGHALQLVTSTTGAWAGEETSRVSATIATAGVISQSFTSTQDRYHRLKVPSYQGQLGEVVLGRDRTPARGPDPTWTDDPTPNVIEETLRSGNTYRVKAGERRRAFSYTFRRLGSADVALFTDLLDQTSDGIHPFFWFPPDSAEAPVYVQLVSTLQRRQDRSNPRGLGQTFEVTLQMLEALA